MAMDCKTFHRILEDYLEGGLDFSGRFNLERHARQCIRCGKELADAQQLRRMVSELQRVKAPVNFEASVLKEIGIRKAHGRFPGLRSFWIYGFEWPSLRICALAASGLAVIGIALFYASLRPAVDRASAPPPVRNEPPAAVAEVEEPAKVPEPVVQAALPQREMRPAAAKPARKPRPAAVDPAPLPEQGVQEAEYVEYLMPGPDNHPVPVRLALPKVIPVRYGQMSEEYFIMNVSH